MGRQPIYTAIWELLKYRGAFGEVLALKLRERGQNAEYHPTGW